jgi:hypothetical protein
MIPWEPFLFCFFLVLLVLLLSATHHPSPFFFSPSEFFPNSFCLFCGRFPKWSKEDLADISLSLSIIMISLVREGAFVCYGKHGSFGLKNRKGACFSLFSL